MMKRRKRMNYQHPNARNPERRRNQHVFEEWTCERLDHVHFILQNDHKAENSDGRPKSKQKNIIKAPDHVRAPIFLCYERILIK